MIAKQTRVRNQSLDLQIGYAPNRRRDVVDRGVQWRPNARLNCDLGQTGKGPQRQVRFLLRRSHLLPMASGTCNRRRQQTWRISAHPCMAGEVLTSPDSSIREFSSLAYPMRWGRHINEALGWSELHQRGKEKLQLTSVL